MSNVAFHPFAGLGGGIDTTQSRQTLNGNVAFTGNYVTGGLLPDWINLTDTAGNPVVVSHTSTSAPVSVVQVGIASNIAIVVGTNIPSNGQYVTFFNVTGNANAAVLNTAGPLVVTNSNPTSSSFNVAVTALNCPNVSVSGFAAIATGPEQFYAESVSGSGLTYGYNRANATIQVFSGNTEIANGSNLAIADTVQGAAEFLKN